MPFLKISEARDAMKGSFVGTIRSAGDLKSGTKDGRDWTKKVFIIEDDSTAVDMVAWGDDISKFKVGNRYEIVNPLWKEYNGDITVNISRYCQVKLIGTSGTQSTMEASTQSAPTQTNTTQSTVPPSDEYLQNRQKEILEKEAARNKQIEEKTKSVFTAEQLVDIDSELDKLIVLESIVTKKLTGETLPNPAKVGMLMKFLYDKLGAKQ